MTSAAVQALHPAELAAGLARQHERLEEADFERRLTAVDASLWPESDAAGDRLGWLRLPESMAPELEAIQQFADEAAGRIRHVLLLGMGGSSLGAEVIQALLGGGPGRPTLTVLDSTHPASVAAYLATFESETTLHVVASKSGSTLETLSLLRSFWEQSRQGAQFVAITDPDTPLAELARERSFRGLFLAPRDVGGRFSALSHFGLVPAALVGADPRQLLTSAVPAREHSAEAIELGALLAEAALAGRDKITLLADPELRPFLDWLEQLLAESTGKQGTGLVPVFDEPAEAHLGEDRLIVRIGVAEADAESLEHPSVVHRWPGPEALGAEMMRWEIATATASWLIGVNPFDQPDVDRAKEIAREAMADPGGAGDSGIPTVDSDDEAGLERAIADWLGEARPGDYITLQVFLPAAEEVRRTIDSLRADLAGTGLATTVGYGPRYLHSTGQLHKGGRDGVFCLQLIDGGDDDLAIPGVDYGYRRLIDAQAIGDARALRERGRKVLRVRVGG